MKSDAPSRREFLVRGGVAALALPAFVDEVLSASPNEQIVTGHVGIGGRGGYLLSQALQHAHLQVGAVCDVDSEHLGKARDRTGKKADAIKDFRHLVDRKDIDAVFVAAPDHWHAGVTIAACRAGKDVYCEKPSSQNVREGREMVETAREFKRVVQVGIHHRSASYNREIARIIRGGRIGKVHAVKTWMWGNKEAPRSAPQKSPAHLDWDFWQGPAPAVAYRPERVHFNFRWCRDYAGGYMTDWGVHMFNMITYAMNVDHMGPDSVEASAEFAQNNIYDFPRKMEARWVYKNPDFELTWSQPAEGGDVLPGQRYGMTFYGEDGQLRTGFGNGLHKFYRDGKEQPFPRKGREVDLPVSPGHIQNFVDCIRSRNEPIADIEIAHRTTLTCLLANIALFSGQSKLDWDWRAEKFRNSETANEWLGREARDVYKV